MPRVASFHVSPLNKAKDKENEQKGSQVGGLKENGRKVAHDGMRENGKVEDILKRRDWGYILKEGDAGNIALCLVGVHGREGEEINNGSARVGDTMAGWWL